MTDILLGTIVLLLLAIFGQLVKINGGDRGNADKRNGK